MAKVLLGMTLSLDGFVQDQDGSVARLYPDLETMRRNENLLEQIRTTGAVVMGRRAYDMAGGDFTGYEFQTPIFILTRRVPEQVAKGENGRLTFNFVTDGIESAIDRAKAAAGDKNVVIVGGASVAQQCLNAGLVDELEVAIRPVFLGAGLRLFEHLDTERIELELIRATETPLTTDLHFRLVR